jgi:SNF2 family DNA or RNA helicase
VLKKEGMLDEPVIIIAPLRVCYSVWPNEIKKWKDFNHFTYEILHGPDKDEAIKRKADIYLINPEGLEWLLGVTKEKKGKKTVISYNLKQFKKLGAKTLVIDEISKFKRTSTDRFQILKQVLTTFDRRWGLTGSPASNGLLDLFGSMYILDLGRSLGRFISHYRSAYFYPTGYGGYTWLPQADSEEAIYERIAPVIHRLSAKDHVQLPQLIENIVKVELPPKVRKIYDELEDEFITELESGIITAVNAGVASMKLCQIANGGLYLQQEVDESGRKASKREWADLHQEKIEATVDLIEELNGAPALILYDFEHDLARLLKAFGKDTPFIGGGISPAKSDGIVADWNAGKIPVLLGHPASMGHGLNLQGDNAANIIFHSLTWDLELYEQTIARLLRSGNKALRVVVHHIVASKTVDIAKMIAVRKKKRTQGALLDAMQEYSKMRKKNKV